MALGKWSPNLWLWAPKHPRKCVSFQPATEKFSFIVDLKKNLWEKLVGGTMLCLQEQYARVDYSMTSSGSREEMGSHFVAKVETKLLPDTPWNLRPNTELS